MLSLLCDMQNERVLFHYNGHGVPRPTVNGEIWVFNKSYTQYIPMSIYDLQAWLGTPCIFVFDCSAAGLIVNSFKAFAEQKTQVGLLYPSFHSSIRLSLHLLILLILFILLILLSRSSLVYSSIHPFSHSPICSFIHIFIHLPSCQMFSQGLGMCRGQLAVTVYFG